MKQLLKNVKRLALALCLATPIVSWAGFERTNPVTGETENYTWKFVGTDTWDGTGNWQDSNGSNPSGTPAKTGDNTWEPILFDNKDPGETISINTDMSVEGWNLRMGLYNGANVTMNTFVKYQGGTTMWMTVDETSQLTVGGFSKGNIADNKVIKLSSAKAGGILWNVNLESDGNANNTFEYYLKGNGSVSYQAVSAANHKIKMADVTLSGGEKEVKSKTLVSFTSSSKTFTADATIKRLNSSGADLGDDALIATVNTTGTTTLTASDAVGTCELVQTSAGIVLYWVDGDPAEMVEKAYKPSISVNFTTGTSLSTAADVGISEYAIPGTSWNNLIGNNGSLTTVTGVDSTGTASDIAGATVTISGTRGYWYYDDNSGATTLYNGYIDDRNNGSDTPTIVVGGIPYDSYKLVVYFSNNSDGVNFGYITVNGNKYKGDNGSTVTCEGAATDKWGSANHSAWTEGGNYLVTPVLPNKNGTLTLISHDLAGCRSGVAAIQIVESKVEDTTVESGDTYVIESALDQAVKIVCDGSFTITGTENYTVTETDLLKLDLDGVTGEVKLGANTCYTLEADRALPSEYKFSEGSTVAISETREEYAKDAFSVEGLTGVSFVKLTRFDGTTETFEVADGMATRGDSTDVKVFAAAALYDFTFTNTVSTAHGSSTTADLNIDGGYSADYKTDETDGTGINAWTGPWIDLRSKIPTWTEFSTVVVGKMPTAHKTMFVSFGSSDGSKKLLFLASGENDNEVVVGYGNKQSFSTLAKMTVPHSAESRHVYAFAFSENRTQMAIYLDGIRWSTVSNPDGFSLGDTSHAGIQIGSGFGGNPPGFSRPERNDTGVFYSLLIYDYVVSDEQIAALKEAYPYSPASGSYSRDVSGETTFETEVNTWTKVGDDEPGYVVPANGAAVALTATDDADVVINATLAAESLTLDGTGAITLKKGDGKLTSEGLTTIATDVTIEMGAADIFGAPTILADGGSITFDCSGFDVESVYAASRIQLTGSMAQDDAKVTIIEPTATAPGRTVRSGYSTTSSCYELVITVDHEAGSDVYYNSGYFGTTESSFAVTNSAGSATAVFPGDTVVIPEYTSGSAYFGATLPANVSAIRVEGDFTFEPGVSDQILDGTTVTVSEGKTLTFGATWHGLNLGDVTLNGPGAVTIDGSKSSNATDVDAGTFRISGAVAGSATITIAAGKAVTAESTSSVANAIVLEAGATLTVPATSQITPTTSVDNCTVTSTDNGDGTKVWSVVEERCSITVTCGENGSIAIYYYDTSSSTWLAAEGDYVPKDAEIKVSVTPDTGYKIDLVEVYMGGLDITESLAPQEENNITTATFTVTDNTTISITFAIKAVSFTVAAVPNTTVKVMDGYTHIYPNEDGEYAVQPQAQVTVIWEADGNFVVTNGQKEWFVPTAGDDPCCCS